MGFCLDDVALLTTVVGAGITLCCLVICVGILCLRRFVQMFVACDAQTQTEFSAFHSV
jgi:hypothetical protein